MTAPPKELLRRDGGKIVLLVIDGLGGLPHPEEGLTEMEMARLPNLDELAQRSSVGRVRMLAPGLTPGSGPGHLALFGYEPTAIDFGRGVLEALGSGHPLAPGEVAARGNFCTLDADGVVVDRRAGRPADAESRAICERLNEKVELDEGKFIIIPGKEHRFTLILQGKELGHHLNDNDPQEEGKKPLPLTGADEPARRTVRMVEELIAKIRAELSGEKRANGVLLRGFSSLPHLEGFSERYGLRAAAIAIYPMYRGVARLVGMEVLDPGKDLSAQIGVARSRWNDFDFFFLHVKNADTAGHVGDFEAKARALEMVDERLPELLSLQPEVLIITGDHSTPCLHREHSWHPVPVLLSSPLALPVRGSSFSERGVLGGELGQLAATDLLPLALAHARRLDKYGA